MGSVNKVILIGLYLDEGKSTVEIAAQFNTSASTIRRWLIASGVKLREKAVAIRQSKGLGSGLRGKKRVFTEEWKENIRKGKLVHGEQHAVGVSMGTRGYLVMTRGEHKGKLLHRFIMEQHIGRPLRSNEDVHHKDEDRTNNSIDNLEILTRVEHGRLHASSRNRNSKGQFKAKDYGKR